MKQPTATQLVNYFISLSNETGNLISNLKLQKMLYYAQAWHLAYFDQKLIESDFEAWIHGPVIPAIYGNFKHFGWHPILVDDLNDQYIKKFCSQFVDKEQCELLQDVVDEYFGLPAFELEKMTHLEKPWQEARGNLSIDEPSSNIISPDTMRDYYKEFLVHGKD